MPRSHDLIKLVTEAGEFDGFEQLSVTNDIAGQTEAIFEFGDDGSADALADTCSVGDGAPHASTTRSAQMARSGK